MHCELKRSDPEKPSVILTASTGKAAANINCTTLHTAFALPVKENREKMYIKDLNWKN